MGALARLYPLYTSGACRLARRNLQFPTQQYDEKSVTIAPAPGVSALTKTQDAFVQLTIPLALRTKSLFELDPLLAKRAGHHR